MMSAAVAELVGKSLLDRKPELLKALQAQASGRDFTFMR
jgi:hypothetical protein